MSTGTKHKVMILCLVAPFNSLSTNRNQFSNCILKNGKLPGLEVGLAAGVREGGC